MRLYTIIWRPVWLCILVAILSGRFWRLKAAIDYLKREVPFTAEVGGDDPLAFAWNFDTAVAAGQQYSAETSPLVTLAETPGSYDVSLVVANAHGSDNYEFTLEVAEGLDMQLLSIRISLAGAENVTFGIFLATAQDSSSHAVSVS